MRKNLKHTPSKLEECKYAYPIGWNSEHWSSVLAKTVLINPWKDKIYYLLKGEEIVLHSGYNFENIRNRNSK